MSQNDIVDWLREQAASPGASDRYFYASEIECALRRKGVSVLKIRSQLNALYVYKFLDVRVDTGFIRRYRLKSKYLREEVKGL